MPGLDDLTIGDGVKVVSFDIFDTLIVRPYIRPKDLFAHMEQAEGAPGFAAERVDAERRSRRSVGADGSRETTFDAIYEEIAPQYRHLKEAELRYKSNVLRYRPVADLFDRLVAEGREVVLISDMYLPSERIASMLESCGIRGYGRLYVSCEHGVNKRHGGLFRRVLEDLGLRPDELHHIGDNAHSDYRVPKGMGIRATRVPSLAESYFGRHRRAARFHRRDGSLSSSVIAATDAIRWMEHGDDLSWREVAYRFGGPAVCGYCAFVHDSGDRPLAFVARDGYNLIRAYRVLFGDSRRATYLYAPRIAYILVGRDYASYRNHKAILADRLFPECAGMDDGERERFFDGHLQEVEARRSSVAAGIRARMEEAAGGGDLTVVDVTTLKYTSQRLVSEMLPDREVDGVYYFVLDDSGPLPHRGYCVRGVFPQPGSNINLTEFFMTAPEPPVRSIDDSGMPVYEEVSDQERRRLDIYGDITDGEVSYAEDMKRLYGGSIPRLEYGAVSRWLRVLTGDRLYRPMLADMGWPVDPANRVYVSMVLHPRDSLYYLKKAVLDTGSALLRLVRHRGLRHLYTRVAFDETEMHPKVSVVVPILNGAEYVPEILSYLDDQTYRDFEAVMVVDVSSTDGSLDAALSAGRDWLRVIPSGIEDAISGPRNLGMDHAEGEFVWFLDADDRPLPDFLERMMSIQQEHDADIVACNFVYSSDKRVDLRKGRYAFRTEVMGSEDAIRARAEERLPVTSWSKVFRLSLLRDNGIRFRRGWCEDIEHTYRALSCARTVCYTDEPLYIYYQHPRSFTNDPANMDSRGGAEQEAYSRLPEDVMDVDGMGSKVALVRIRSSGHMTYRSFMVYARSDGCRGMLKRECSEPLVPEAMWYYFSPTTYYIAIRLFLRFWYYRDGRTFTKPAVRRGRR